MNAQSIVITNHSNCTITVTTDCGQFNVDANQTVRVDGQTSNWAITDGANTYAFSNNWSGSLGLCSNQLYDVDAYVETKGGVTSDIIVIDPTVQR
jgi:hypothetical protein